MKKKNILLFQIFHKSEQLRKIPDTPNASLQYGIPFKCTSIHLIHLVYLLLEIIFAFK